MRYASRALLAPLLLLALSSIGCASGSRAGSDSPSPTSRRVKVEAPTMLGGPRPDFQPEQMDASIRVTVNADGTADMSTLIIGGTVSGNNRNALSRWIANARFNPGRRDGVPVAAQYTTRIKSRIERIRR